MAKHPHEEATREGKSGHPIRVARGVQLAVSLVDLGAKSLDEIKEFINICENIFDNTKIIFEKKWNSFKELFDKKNISRKDCLLLPLRTVNKALNDKNK